MTTTLAIVALVACIFALWKNSRPRKRSANAQRTSSSPKLRTTGKFFREVVGESHYQGALRMAAGGHETLGLDTTATLCPEPDNKFDPHAIGVFIGTDRVGYLSRDDARDYHARLKRAGLALDVYSCPARIVGGGKKHYGVWLDLPDRLA